METVLGRDPSRCMVPIEARANSSVFLGMCRPQLLTFLSILLISNAMLPTIVQGIALSGLVDALVATFHTSAVVWIALIMGILSANRAENGAIDRLDRMVFSACVLLCLLPLGPMTWGVLSCFGFYLVVRSRGAVSWQKSAGWVLFAVSVPMFWSKRVFSIFADYILAADAVLVASITHTSRTANLVAMPGGQGFLEIGGPCSSIANVSLAFLCWVVFTQMNSIRWHPRNLFWCGAACTAVIAINVLRIVLIGYFPTHYDLLHNGIGATVAAWLTSISCLAICHYGVQIEKRRALLA